MIACSDKKELDEEWVELIKEAIMLGISIGEIKDFLNKKS